jgi:hypothetical protein
VETGSAGHYYFQNISVGEKTVRAEKDGYGSGSATVVVVADSTVTAEEIILSPVTGQVTGRALDAIYVNNDVADPLFDKRLILEIIPQGDSPLPSRETDTGTYGLDLEPGTYKIRASHEYYHPDSVTVVVPADGQAAADDLVMAPACSLYGNVSLDMDHDGSYETTFHIETNAVGARLYDSGPAIEFVACEGEPLTDVVQMLISTERVQGPGIYSLGDLTRLLTHDEADCAPVYMTGRHYCYDPDDGTTSAMTFSISGDPVKEGCNCGITDFGNLYIEEPFGIELAEVVRGGITAYLPGWKTCHCWCCEDSDGDGQEDDWVAECARAYINLNFVVLMGSRY